MEEYTPNSHRYKEEQKQLAEKKDIKKVVSGNVKARKNNGSLKSMFISEDAANIKSFVLMDVLIPAVKKAVSDIVTNGIEMILYGSSGSGRRKSVGDRVTYTNFYDKRDRDRRHSEPTNRNLSYDNFSFEKRGDAELVLTRLDEVIEKYGIASIADYKEFIGEQPQHTDHRYGWMNLRNARVIRDRGEYVIELPKAMPID